MSAADPVLVRALDRHLSMRGSSLTELDSRAEAVLLFGSRGAGCAHLKSDWDLLCVGDARTTRARDLDLIWVGSERLRSSRWQEGELAGHVALWGVLVCGRAPWLAHARERWSSARIDTSAAAARKRRVLVGQISGLRRVWTHLGPAHRHAQFTALRRDLQRHDLLSRGRPVPPTAHLDRQWANCDRREQWVSLTESMWLCRQQLDAFWPGTSFTAP